MWWLNYIIEYGHMICTQLIAVRFMKKKCTEWSLIWHISSSDDAQKICLGPLPPKADTVLRSPHPPPPPPHPPPPWTNYQLHLTSSVVAKFRGEGGWHPGTPSKTSGHGVVVEHTSCKQHCGWLTFVGWDPGFESQVAAFVVPKNCQI